MSDEDLAKIKEAGEQAHAYIADVLEIRGEQAIIFKAALEALIAASQMKVNNNLYDGLIKVGTGLDDMNERLTEVGL